MKPLHIVLLICAGALGGAVVTKVWQKHPAPTAAVARVEQPSATAPQTAPAATPAEPTATPTQDKPSPVVQEPPAAPPAAAAGPRRSPGPAPAKAPVKFPKNPPPAHPRPLVLAQGNPPSAQSQAPVAEAQPLAAPPEEPVPQPVRQPEPQPAASSPAATPEAESPHKVTLNAGMLIPVRLVDGLSSERNVPGDMFAGTLDRALVVDGFIIAERGARVEGRVVAADRGTKVKGNAAIAVELTRLHTSDGQDVAIQTESFERHSAVDHGTDAAKVGGGAVIGAIIGAIAGGGKGAAIGAGAGAGAGGADVLLTRKPARLPSETRINFRLRAPVTLTERKG